MIYVTHDLSEALFLGNDILSIVKGRKEPGWLGYQLNRMFSDTALLNRHHAR